MGNGYRLERIHREFGETIDSAALNPGGWQDVVDTIFTRFPGTKVAIHTNDRDQQGTAGVVYCGFEQRAIEEYSEHYSRVNPWAPFWAQFPCLRAAASDETAPASLFLETEFYQDWLAPVREAESASGVKLAHENGWISLLSVHYGKTISRRYNHDLTYLLNSNTTRIRRALELSRIATASVVKKHASDFVAQFEMPAMVLDSRARLVGMNARAERELSAADVFRVGPRETVSLIDEKASERLKTAVAQIASNRGTFCGGCDIEISRPSTLLASLFAFVPRSSSILLPFGNLQRLVLLLIRSPTIVSSAGDNTWDGFNLTPAERRIADAVAAGLSVRESADRLGIAYETARTHLKSVFAKTGVQRQAALVALRNTISAAASASAEKQPTASDS